MTAQTHFMFAPTNLLYEMEPRSLVPTFIRLPILCKLTTITAENSLSEEAKITNKRVKNISRLCDDTEPIDLETSQNET